ncbi:MAG: HD domain-containing protein [Anaerolineae bacterium]|nr:HD domain-containing protein [Gemmatimonadaceae bacterium]
MTHPPAPHSDIPLSLDVSSPDSGPRGAARSSLSEILSALSFALDLTEGQRPGHTIRSCIIGMRLGEEIGLSAEDRIALYFALLLKDAGCSSNAARMAALFGSDDQSVKFRMKMVDWHRPVRLAVQTALNCGVGRSIPERLRRFREIAATENMTRSLMQIRCDRGADISLRLGFPVATADAIRALDEHWCGFGHPQGMKAGEIPVLARIANLAQVVEVFFTAHGVGAALRVAKTRSGRWFDPVLVNRVLSWKRDRAWWSRLADNAAVGSEVVALEPGSVPRSVDSAGVDAIARAFAEIIDAKTPYTARHSSNVAAYAVAIGREMGFGTSELDRLYRAGLLHDIGKLGVSNLILDKQGKLTPEERAAVEKHPLFTWEILRRVSAFEDIAWLASVHHEKLDRTGYPWQLPGDQLDTPARILAVADIFEALTADRPYRAGMPPEKAIAILRSESATKLCPDAVAGCEGWLRRDAGAVAVA